MSVAGGAKRASSCQPVVASYPLTPTFAWKLGLKLREVSDLPLRYGTLFRTRLFLDAPVDPPMSYSLGQEPGFIGHTRYWEVEKAASCR